jgi:hypothetical protein
MKTITFKLCARHYRVYDEDPDIEERGWQDLIFVLGKYAKLGYAQVILAIEPRVTCDHC